MVTLNINEMRARNEFLNNELVKPEILGNQNKYKVLAREQRDLLQIIRQYERLQSLERQIADDLSIIEADEDKELVAIAKEELDSLESKKDKLEEELKMMLIPRDPNDVKNAIVEIRAGTGGDEAGIFAGDLYRLYTRYCEINHYKIEVLNSNHSERGGFKEIIFNVVILPEAEDVDIEINPNELRIDVFRSSGPGGQSVNTTDSAVRITHIPSGMVVTCQDEKSQLKNKNKALKVLKTRLLDKARQAKNSDIASQRKSMVGGGDRSAKIRTYNYPQGRVTDHRINLTLYKLDRIMEGEIDEFIDQLHLVDRTEKLQKFA
jgi:peptide chain release factor 1